MPELPEVETIKNELAPHVVGRTIVGVDVLWHNLVRMPSVDEFRDRLLGRKIVSLGRRGKYLLIKLNGGGTLVVHLKMTGSLWRAMPPEGERYVRAVIRLDGGKDIYFRDPRKFGKMWLVSDTVLATGNMGPEPLEPDFTVKTLGARLRGHRIPIKAALLDQALLAGVGNMYADEALFAARIHPLLPADSLTLAELKRLHKAIRDVLIAGIGYKGASVENYFRPDGAKGDAHLAFKVAHRQGKPCPVCGTPISYIKVRGRGTHFCARCQPARESSNPAR